jgi:hypothetical protein
MAGNVDALIAQGIRQPQVESPQEASQRALTLGSLVQQQQLGQAELAEKQNQLSQMKALNDAYRSSVVVNPDGTADVDTGRLTQALAASGHGGAIPAVLKQVNDYKQSSANLSEAQGKVAALEADAAGALGASVRQANYDPHLFMTLMQHAVQAKHVDPQAVGPLVNQVAGALQNDPTGASAQQAVKQITDQLIASSPKQRELDTNAATAAARKQTADTAAAKETREGFQQQRSNAASELATATDPDSYQATLNKYPANIQAAFPPANAFDPVKTPAFVRQLAMTTDQQVQTGQAAANAAETARHNAVDEGAANKRIALDASRLGLERQRLGFDMSGGVSPTAQMAVAGKIDPQQLRMMLRSQPGLMGQIQKLDPNFDEATLDNRYNTLKEFTNTSNGKAGGQALALNTLIHHAELYQETADALNNGTFKPGNAIYNKVATAFGSAPPTNAALVAQFFAGETGKVATGGVPAEGEVNKVLDNLKSDASPDQISGAGRTLLQIAAGRAVPLMERVKNAKLDNVVQVLGPDAKSILQQRGFDPDTLKPVAAAPLPAKLSGSDVGKLYMNKAGAMVRITAVNPQDGTQFRSQRVQ